MGSLLSDDSFGWGEGMSLVNQYFLDLKALLRQGNPYLFYVYHFFVLKNLLCTKIFSIKTGRERFYGFTVYHNNFNSFFAVFTEIFVHQIYKSPPMIAPTIVDCGANIGLATLYYKMVFPDCKVFAFEPDHENFLLLRLNVQGNGLRDVWLFEQGVGDKFERKSLFSPKEFQGSVGSTTNKECNFHECYSECEVQIVPVSSLKESHGVSKIDVLKIDVEGDESLVFKDLFETGMLSSVGVVALEYHFVHGIQSNKLSTILDYVERAGLQCYISHDDLIGEWVTWDTFKKYHRYILIIKCYNNKVLCVEGEK